MKINIFNPFTGKPTPINPITSKNLLFSEAITFNAGAVNVVTTLLDYTIPAGTMKRNGQSIRGRVQGQFSNTAGGNYSLYLYFDNAGANDISPTLDIPLSANSRYYVIDFVITRTSANHCYISCVTTVINNGVNTVNGIYYTQNSFDLNTTWADAYHVKMESTNASVGTVNGVITKEYTLFDLVN